MSGVIISHPAFKAEYPPSARQLKKQWVASASDIPKKLASSDIVPSIGTWRAAFLWTVVDADGIITQMVLNGDSGKSTGLKFPARSLAANAPEKAQVLFPKVNWQRFEFPPGQSTSAWIKASEVGVKYLMGPTQADGFYSTDDVSVFMEPDFAMRLHIALSEKVDEVDFVLMAVPLRIDNLTSLPHFVHPSPFYPTIPVWSGPAHFATFRKTPNTGLPILPFWTTTEETLPVVNAKDMVKKIRGFMSEVPGVRASDLPEWDIQVRGDEVEASELTSPVTQPFLWPPLVSEDSEFEEEENREEEDAVEDQTEGKNIIPVFLSNREHI